MKIVARIKIASERFCEIENVFCLRVRRRILFVLKML